MGINGGQIISTAIQEGGKLVAEWIRSYSPSARSKKAAEVEEKTLETKAPPVLQSTTASPASPERTRIVMPTREQTTVELKRRLARELYKAELDLTNGLMIAGRPCDCLSEKHTLELDACAEEMVSQEPDNTVYQEVRQWIVDNQHKVTPEAIVDGKFKAEYPHMARQFKEFRKRVLGTSSSLVVEPRTQNPEPRTQNSEPKTQNPITLEEAKQIAAKQAAEKVERLWTEQR